MANATARVAKGATRKTDEFIQHSAATLSAATTFYTHAMLGLTTGGYLAKFDDTQALRFFGLVRGGAPEWPGGGNPKLPVGTAGDGTLDLDVHQPPRFELAIASVAITDIDKKVYALFDQTGTLDSSATTYGNLIGHVVDLVYAVNRTTPVSGIALVEPCYDGLAAHARYGAARVLPATGAVTLTKLDLNKTIFIPSTAAQAITLPAVADTQAGDRFTFVKTTANAVAATLTGAGSELIDGSNTLATIDAQFDTAILVSTGTAWVVVARDIA